jgi:hypothetical protein
MLDIDVVGLTQLMSKMKKFKHDIQKPDLSFGVRGMARVWAENFSSEGSMVGGWRPLAPSTQKKRIERGFDPNHPILQQTGALRRVTITSLLAARGPRSVSGDGIAMTSVYHGLSAVLNSSGEKSKNQQGGKNEGGTRIPPRPYWFVDGRVTKAAEDGISRWVTKMLGDYR